MDAPGESTSALGSHPRARSDVRYRHVLIVEDEVRLRQIIAQNLTSRGCIVTEATTAGEAVQVALEDRPDLMLLDLNLPDQSGWDVLRDLRTHAVEIPTIVVSAVRVVPGRLTEFRPLAYLPKPFPLEALLRLVLVGATVPNAPG